MAISVYWPIRPNKPLVARRNQIIGSAAVSRTSLANVPGGCSAKRFVPKRRREASIAASPSPSDGAMRSNPARSSGRARFIPDNPDQQPSFSHYKDRAPGMPHDMQCMGTNQIVLEARPMRSQNDQVGPGLLREVHDPSPHRADLIEIGRAHV